jgi:hypothetical protein
MAIIETAVIFALIVLLMCWPEFFVRKSARDFVSVAYMAPIALVVIVGILIVTRFC